MQINRHVTKRSRAVGGTVGRVFWPPTQTDNALFPRVRCRHNHYPTRLTKPEQPPRLIVCSHMQLAQALRARSCPCLAFFTADHSREKGAAPQALHLHGASLNVVLYSAWRADNNVHTAPQDTLLWPIRGAPIDTESAQTPGPPDVFKLLMYLH